MDNRPCVLSLISAQSAVLSAFNAGLLKSEDDPWHRDSGAHPADVAMDDTSLEPDSFFEGWLPHFVAALRLCEIGRGVVYLSRDR